MLTILSAGIVGLSLALALWIVGYLVLGRTSGERLLLGLLVLEAALVVQLVVGVGMLLGTDRDVSVLSFLGYLLVILVVLPLGYFWSRAEQTRSGTAVLLLAVLVIPVLVLRLEVIWGG